MASAAFLSWFPDSLLRHSGDLLLGLLLSLSLIYLLTGLDDLFIDLVALFRRLRPEELGPEQLQTLAERPQRATAILVPAWKESGIIQRMLSGNIDRIEYGNYVFFVGVYPNDLPTVEKVQAMTAEGAPVVAVVNRMPGPTSKGQMLNQVIEAVIAYETDNSTYFDNFLMQDAEDVIHPKTLQLANERLERFDFVQMPVFSLSVTRGKLVASTYMDEFAESHTKDLLVRNSLGAAVPSAGVGTAMSRRLIEAFRLRNKSIFNEGSVTEDYELGNHAHNLGYASHFACCYYRLSNGAKEFIATREFFPKSFFRSLRQKTRWTIGIAFQGRRNLPWVGTWANRYFLYRDRRGPMANILAFLGYPALLACLFEPALSPSPELIVLAKVLLTANLFLMLNRFLQRMSCVARVYGWSAAWPVAFAWPVANTINAFAGLYAARDDLRSRITQTKIQWAKTEHELPEFFGTPVKGEV